MEEKSMLDEMGLGVTELMRSDGAICIVFDICLNGSSYFMFKEQAEILISHMSDNIDTLTAGMCGPITPEGASLQ